MGKQGPAFYDDDAAFADYMARRRRPDNPNDTLEQPVLRELAGAVTGCRILDLGCGDAAFGRHVLACGCGAYVGVDGSRNMVAAAHQTLAGTPGEVVHAAIEHWTYPSAAFDLVVSSLALHYVADLEAVFARVFRTLKSGGRFVFSVEHPVITSCDRGLPSGQRQAWLVDDYFDIGARVTTWHGQPVRKYHRTTEAYVAALQGAGFTISGLRESHPQRALFTDNAEYERRKRIPLFLFLAGQKPA